MHPHAPHADVRRHSRRYATTQSDAEKAYRDFQRLWRRLILDHAEDICVYCGEAGARDLDHFVPKGRPDRRNIGGGEMFLHAKRLVAYVSDPLPVFMQEILTHGSFLDYGGTIFPTYPPPVPAGHFAGSDDPHNILPSCVHCNQSSAHMMWYHGYRFRRGKSNIMLLLGTDHLDPAHHGLIHPNSVTWCDLARLFRFFDFGDVSRRQTTSAAVRGTLVLPAPGLGNDELLRTAATIELFGLNSKRRVEARWQARRLVRLDMNQRLEQISKDGANNLQEPQFYADLLECCIREWLATPSHRLATLDAVVHLILNTNQSINPENIDQLRLDFAKRYF